jgi:hypothetical protein
MRARQLLDGAAFGPDAVKAIGEASMPHWGEINPRFGKDPRTVEGARLRPIGR